MSLDKKDFYGKEVTDAIKLACDTFGVAQEKLDIEVIETGSTGIFGLIRKKARIRAQVKVEVEGESDAFGVGEIFDTKIDVVEKVAAPPKTDKEVKKAKLDPPAAPETKPATPVTEEAKPEVPAADTKGDDKPKEEATEPEPPAEASPESLELVKSELLQVVELMGFPSALDVESKGLSVTCTLRGDFEENLIGQEGKTLDSLQYILRKIVARKVPERLRISINVGEFREKRIEELKVRAVELAALVKEDGKTQVIPALNPSERRVVHMILQEDKEIRSRSVGDGLFKKILIYKPGKGNRQGGRKRSPSRGRQGKNGQNQKQKDES